MRNPTLTVLLLLVLTLGAGAQKASPFAANDPLARALQSNPVFVGKTLRDRVSTSALSEIVRSEPADHPLKIVVVNQLPIQGKRYKTRGAYTQALHDYLRMGRGVLFVVTHNGVSVATTALPAQRTSQIVQDNASAIQSDPVAGIRQTVRALDNAIAGGGANAQADNPGQPNSQIADNGGAENAPSFAPVPQQAGLPTVVAFSIMFILLLVVGFVLWLIIKAITGGGQRKQQVVRQMQDARAPIERLRGEVVNGITYADTYLDLLARTPDVDAARQERQQAAQLLEQAKALSQSARTPQDWGRAQAILEQARQFTATCRQRIDAATGGTGVAVAISGTDYRATPATGNGTGASQAAPVLPGLNPEDIPVNERAACYFCSRPARIADLTPVDVVVQGQRRKVLACGDDVRIIQHGATPEVRTVRENGQPVPWYRSRSYDPYRDYHRVEVVYVPTWGWGYDPFFWGPPMGYGYAPMPYPVYVDSYGSPVVDQQQAAPPPMDSDLTGVGSADFFGTDLSASPGMDYDNQSNSPDYGDSGDNSDFGSNNADYGSNDDSSNSDSGSSDTGSADWGSSDSGSDSGGGDFGGGDSGGGGGDY